MGTLGVSINQFPIQLNLYLNTGNNQCESGTLTSGGIDVRFKQETNMFCNCIASKNEPNEAKVEDKDIHAVKQSPKVARNSFPNVCWLLC
ncbi:unnamed protein product [Amaranthus hypochondriacus]